MNISKLMRVSALALLAPSIAGCVSPMKVEGSTFTWADQSYVNFAQAKSRDGLGQDATQTATEVCAVHLLAADGSNLPPTPSATQIPGITSSESAGVELKGVVSNKKCLVSTKTVVSDGIIKTSIPSIATAAGLAGYGALVRPAKYNNTTSTSVQNAGSTAIGGNTSLSANATGGASNATGGKADIGNITATASPKVDVKATADAAASASAAAAAAAAASAPAAPPPPNDHGGGDHHGGDGGSW